jgi:hypothetical protein
MAESHVKMRICVPVYRLASFVILMRVGLFRRAAFSQTAPAPEFMGRF